MTFLEPEAIGEEGEKWAAIKHFASSLMNSWLVIHDVMAAVILV